MNENEIEEDRQKALAKHKAEDTDLSKFDPGSHGCHEALHTVYLIDTMVSNEVLDHPSIVNNPIWYAKAYKIQHELWQLYQDIGKEHLI